MPHAVRRVVVARWGRIAGALAAWLGAEAMVIAAVSPAVAGWVTSVLPGREPAPLSTLLVGAWVLGLVAYWIARSTAEHRFAVTMSRTVLPGEDVFHDIERLDHVHPDDVARGMAHRLEVLSAALPVAAAATILPATVAYVAMLVSGHHWPSERVYEAWIADHAHALAWTAMLGLVASFLMTKTAMRQQIAAPIAATIAVVTVGLTPVLWWLVGPIAIAVVIAFVVRKLVKERALIQAEDPAAGSEVFTLRGFIAQVRVYTIQARAFARAHKRGFAIAAVSLPLLAITWKVTHPKTWKDPAPPAVAHPHALPLPTEAGVRFASQRFDSNASLRSLPKQSFDGNSVRVELKFVGSEPVILTSVFPGIDAVPPGWRAHLAVTYLAGGGNGITVVAFPTKQTSFDQHPQWIDSYNHTTVADITACGQSVPIGDLRIEPDSKGPAEQYVTLLITPTLELATTCP